MGKYRSTLLEPAVRLRHAAVTLRPAAPAAAAAAHLYERRVLGEAQQQVRRVHQQLPGSEVVLLGAVYCQLAAPGAHQQVQEVDALQGRGGSRRGSGVG